MYNEGDKVWLFNPAVPKGASRKFHKPWSGPYTVIKQISDITYRIQHAYNHRKRVVVHFDCLKPWNGDVQEKSKGNKPPVQHNVGPSYPLPPSHTLTLYDDDDDDDVTNMESSADSATQRYPCCTHHAPARFDAYVPH